MSSTIHNEGLGRAPLLLAQARAAVLPSLVETFGVALGRFDDALFDRAERAGHSQMAFLDAMRELRRRREEIIGRFHAHLDKAWQALEAGSLLSVESALADSTNTLSLVSDQELESRLAARNLASVILRDCKPVLQRLDRRLGLIAGDLVLDNEHNPIGPEHIGVAVHQAFVACDLAPDVRLVVIKLCERDLVPAIARIYDRYAAAISVLTDEAYFQGNFDFLPLVRQQVKVPVLCKDFIVDPYQIYLARHYQADAILLMLSVLTDDAYSSWPRWLPASRWEY